jgi:hypothetical protein
MEATRWDRNPKWLIEPPLVWPHLQTKLTTMEREHFIRMRDAWTTLANRCEFLDIPDLTPVGLLAGSRLRHPMPDRPRTFKEVVADIALVELARIAGIEAFTTDQVEVYLAGDRDEPGDWRVEYFDAADGCFVTIFAAPLAEKRARAYFLALLSEQLKIICEDGRNAGS